MSKQKKIKTLNFDEAHAKQNKKNFFSTGNKKNAFELHINKARFKILGRTCQHDKGLPGASRGIALQMRKKTIGKEFKQDNKRNNFKDHRIRKGSEVFHNDARFIVEKMSEQHKSRRFDFQVADSFTHCGKNLKELDHFVETVDVSENLHDYYPHDHKTGPEGLITETTFQKRGSVESKNDISDLTNKLDNSYKELIPFVCELSSSNYVSTKKNDFDIVVREMISESRSAVCDRLKTLIEGKNGERKINIGSADKFENCDLIGIDGNKSGALVFSKKGILIPGINKQHPKDFNPDRLKNGETNFPKISYSGNLSGVQPEEISDKEKRKIKHLSSKSEENTYFEIFVKNELKSQKMNSKIPLVYEMPSNYKQLKDLLGKHCVDSQTILVERILKSCYVEQEHKNQKIVKFFGFLLQYLSEIFNNPLMETIANSFKIFNNIFPYLHDIMYKNTKETSVCLLNVIRKIYSKNMKNCKSHPSLKALVFLKMVSNLYTTSDYTNSVISPCYHFISHILPNVQVRTRQDIAKGLFLVTLSLEYSRFSHRLIPAALNFLKAVIEVSIPNTQIKTFKSITSCMSREWNILELTEKPKMKLDGNTNKLLIAEDLVASTISSDFKIRALNLALKLTKDAIEGISNNKGSNFLAESFIPLMRKININVYPKYVKSNFESIMLSFLTINESPMKKLMSADKQVNALHVFEPLVETTYDDKRRTKSSKAKEEKLKMKQKIRRETKGAVRDIRRDAEFLQKIQIIQRVKSDRVRKEKVKSIFEAASIQQGELNALKKQKIKE